MDAGRDPGTSFTALSGAKRNEIGLSKKAGVKMGRMRRLRINL